MGHHLSARRMTAGRELSPRSADVQREGEHTTMIKFLQRYFERRSLANPSPELLRMFDAGPTAAGITVTPAKALSVPAVYACVQVLAQDVAKTPVKLRRKVAADTFVDAVEHPLWEILHDLANPEVTAFDTKRQMQADLLLHERAYAEIVRVDGVVTALWRLDPERVTVDRDEARRKRWRYTDDRGQAHTWAFSASTPPIFELSHPSPIRHCRELIATALALQRYVGAFFGNGARIGGLLLTDIDLDEQQQDQLGRSFSQTYAGTENSWRTAVLAGGLKYQPIAAPNDAAQLNETMQTIATQIAAAFRLPPWKMGITEKTSYSNLEQGAIDYATGTLDPLFTCWEHAIRRDLLTTRQYGSYEVTFDRSTLIRADVKSLHEALARGRDAGFYSANDVRRKLGENPIPADHGGDRYLVNGNLTPMTEAGTNDQQS
jgi:HK97 family phage portal protein